MFDFIVEIYSNALLFFFCRLYFHFRKHKNEDMSKEDLSDDDPEWVSNDDDDDASITSDQEAQLMNVIIPLDDCLDCHVQLTYCQVSLQNDKVS